MSIPTRRLLGTSLDVSVLCYGPMRLATAPTDPLLPVHERAMRAALDGGINFVHSSYEYGVRWLMNRVLSDHPARHDLHHVIKVPVPDWDDSSFDAQKYEARIDQALRELCCEQIALVQWMWRIRPHDETHRLPLLVRCIDALKDTHARLAQKGKVGALATFPYFPQSAAASMMCSADFRCLIGYYNLLEVELSPVADMLETDGRGFLAIRPLYEGVLTDRFADHASVPADHRLKAPKYAAAFEKRAALMAKIPEIAEQGITKSALHFPLMSENCASVIVGMNTEEQVKQLINLCADLNPNPTLAARIRAEVAAQS